MKLLRLILLFLILRKLGAILETVRHIHGAMLMEQLRRAGVVPNIPDDEVKPS